ncbi:hypothetical protein GQR58_027847 [Nymphon striatum]|nr:hypothetical protein GQR58_027847 [Nymphon striatum]
MDAARDAMDAVRDVIPVAYRGCFEILGTSCGPLLLLEGWEEEEIIDKKDSAEGKTPNLPYRNSVVSFRHVRNVGNVACMRNLITMWASLIFTKKSATFVFEKIMVSVFMGVFINFTSCQLDVAFPYVRTGLAIHFLFQTLHEFNPGRWQLINSLTFSNCFTHPKVTSQTSHSVFVQLGKMMGVNGKSESLMNMTSNKQYVKTCGSGKNLSNSDVTNSVFVQLGKMMGVNVPMESLPCGVSHFLIRTFSRGEEAIYDWTLFLTSTNDSYRDRTRVESSGR